MKATSMKHMIMIIKSPWYLYLDSSEVDPLVSLITSKPTNSKKYRIYMTILNTFIRVVSNGLLKTRNKIEAAVRAKIVAI